VGLIIGKGGEMIQSLQVRSGAKIVIATDTDRNAPTKKITISGNETTVTKARELIDEILYGQQRVCLYFFINFLLHCSKWDILKSSKYQMKG
jgi:hypothetical protein